MKPQSEKVEYKDGFKHQVFSPTYFHTEFKLRGEIKTQFITLGVDGLLTALPGYAWDGASGPTWDDDVYKFASLPHDMLYQLMRMGLLDNAEWKLADQEFKKAALICLKSKKLSTRILWKARLPIAMAGLAFAKGQYADPSERKKVRVT
jgi:hypothetical protein